VSQVAGSRLAGPFQWQGSRRPVVHRGEEDSQLRLRQLVIAIIILIITGHLTAFGNQSARLSGAAVAE
jgi:hypothetical protein